MSEKYVPDGVYLLCNKGASPCGFMVTENSSAFLYGQKSGSAGDNKFGANLTGFGFCSVLRGPCSPALLNWQNTATGITTGMNPLLIDSSKMICNFGGMIEIKFNLPDMFKALEEWQGKQFDSIEKMADHLPQPMKGYFQLQVGVAEGILVGAESLVEGLWSLGKMGFQAISHPVETAQAIGKGVGKAAEWAKKNPEDAALLVMNPVAFAGKKIYDNREAIGQMGGKAVEAMKNGSARDWGRWTGRAAFEIGSLFVGAAEIKALAKGSELAKVGEVAEAGNVLAKGAELATDAEKVAKEAKSLGAVVRSAEEAAEDAAKLERAAQEARAAEEAAKCAKSECAFGHPVDAITGHVYFSYIDFELPGPIPLKWEREYNSGSNYTGNLGKKVSSSYDLPLIENKKNNTVEIIQKNCTSLILNMPAEHEPSYHPLAQVEVYRFNNSFKVFDYKTRWYYTYDTILPGLHKPILLEDERGFSIRFIYLNGHLNQIIDSAGRRLDVSCNSKGYITKITLLTNVEKRILVSYEYNDEGDMISIADSLNQKNKLEYKNHLIIKEILRNGLSFFWEYDLNARCIHTWGDDGLFEYFFKYADKKNVISTPIGTDSTIYYNELYKPIQITDALGNSKYFRYSKIGQLTEEIDEEGLSTRYNFDERGNLIQTTYPDESTQTFVFDEKNRLVLSTDRSGNNTQWIYQEDKLFYIETSLSKNIIRYNKHNLISKIKNERGEETFLEYDEQYNLEKLTLPDGRITKWKYNLFAECIQLINPLGEKQCFDYDRLGRVKEVKLPNTEIIDLKYDEYNNILQANSLHHKIKYSYTPLGSIKSREEHGIRITFQYDKQERLKALTNEQGSLYSFCRDKKGNIIKETSFDGITKYYNRDRAGKVIRIDKPGGKSTTYEYDKGGRIIRAQYNDGSWETFVYNKRGQLIEARNQQTEINFVRNSLGQILFEKQGEHSINYTYNEKGDLLNLKSSLGADVVYKRDEKGLTSSIEAKHKSSEETWIVNIRRNMLGLEIERNLPGGIKSTWSYDEDNNPLRQQTIYNGQRVGLRKEYSWNANQQLQKITNILTNSTTNFGYDIFGNLAWEQFEDGSYDYKLPDEIGNIYRNKLKDDKEYGVGGRLIKDNDWYYQYDDEGNLIIKSVLKPSTKEKKKVEVKFSFVLDENESQSISENKDQSLISVNMIPSGTANNKSWIYKWSANGMLEQVTDPNGKVVRFEYDALGRRTAKIVGEKINRYVWDGNVLLHEWSYDISKRPIFEINTWGELMQNRPEPIGENLVTWIYEDYESVPSAKLIGNDMYSIVSDYIGRPVLAFNKAGEIVWKTSYNIYGKLKELNGSKSFIPFRQLGQYEDEELDGLYYNRFRYYDCNLGIYISQDPIGLEGTNPNFYSYTYDSNSVVDRYGLIEEFGIAGYTSARHAKDGLTAHELLQNAWLRNNGHIVGRSSGIVSSNPSIALVENQMHKNISKLQAKYGLHDPNILKKQSAIININRNTAITRRGIYEDLVKNRGWERENAKRFATERAMELRKQAVEYAKRNGLAPMCAK